MRAPGELMPGFRGIKWEGASRDEIPLAATEKLGEVTVARLQLFLLISDTDK